MTRRPSHRLAAHELSLAYRSDTVVEGASVALVPGEVTVLLGPNGSGKSTLLRALARLHAPTSGRVTLEGDRDADALTPLEFSRQVTLLAQTRPRPAGLSVHDVICFGRHPHRRRFAPLGAADRRAVAEAADVTGLSGLLDRPVEHLSGGELQRVWFASCLAQQTGVLLLDEPTNHLDLRYQVEVLGLVRDLADDAGVAVGVVLHDLDDAASIADHVVLLDRGRVRAAGCAADVLRADLLSEVYGVPVDVTRDAHGGLSVRPRRRGLATRRVSLPRPA